LKPELAAVARLLRARGIKGELVALPLNDRKDRFERLRDVVVNGRDYGVERVWWHDGRLILKFRGVDNMSQAELLAGQDVSVPMAERPSLPADEFYLSDLVECAVIDRASGAAIGIVTGWQECGEAHLLEIERASGGEQILIPFARSICVEIDPAARRIVVEAPEGLLELNR
jgi:16S rRNA processing protein RimM